MLQLETGSSSNRFHLHITHDRCVGPEGHVFLFGGVGHSAMIAAMKEVVGMELIWSTTHFLSFAREGAVLDIDVKVAVQGRNVGQVTAVGRVGDDVVLTSSAAFGTRPNQNTHQWTGAPAMLDVEDCIESRIWPRQAGGFLTRLEVRLDPNGPGVGHRDGTLEPTGRLKLWVRSRESVSMDAGLLAIMGDMLPAVAASAVGSWGGGNSLDNTLRIAKIVPSEWVLCDMQVAAMDRGFIHGENRMFAEDGTLLAVASQSILQRYMSE